MKKVINRNCWTYKLIHFIHGNGTNAYGHSRAEWKMTDTCSYRRLLLSAFFWTTIFLVAVTTVALAGIAIVPMMIHGLFQLVAALLGFGHVYIEFSVFGVQWLSDKDIVAGALCGFMLVISLIVFICVKYLPKLFDSVYEYGSQEGRLVTVKMLYRSAKDKVCHPIEFK